MIFVWINDMHKSTRAFYGREQLYGNPDTRMAKCKVTYADGLNDAGNHGSVVTFPLASGTYEGKQIQ